MDELLFATATAHYGGVSTRKFRSALTPVISLTGSQTGPPRRDFECGKLYRQFKDPLSTRETGISPGHSLGQFPPDIFPAHFRRRPSAYDKEKRAELHIPT